MATYKTSFTVNLADLTKILDQIKIAERNAAGESLVDIIGQDAALLPMGLRTVDGSFNHLLPGQSLVGAADQIFPRLLPPEFHNDKDGDTITLVRADVPGAPPGGVVLTNTDYNPLIPGSHSVVDADPRIISNLIVDATLNNPAALQTALVLAGSTHVTADVAAITAAYNAVKASQAADPGGVASPTTVAALSNLIQAAGLEVSSDGSLTIENRSPDIGLSPGFNGWMTFFGQFFDHGLDLVTKGGNGTVYIPLMADDPLYDKGADGVVGPVNGHNDDGYGADGILGTVDDRPNFMALTRGTLFVDPATGLKTEMQNTTTPFVDQNQTYTSHASHQVFLREYRMANLPTDAVAGPVAVATGRMLDGAQPGSIANWGEVKAQAKSMLGLTLDDYYVNDVPLLLADAYGKFIPGTHGFAQAVVSVSILNAQGAVVSTIPGQFVVEGKAGGLDLANLTTADVLLPANVAFPALNPGETYRVSTVGTGAPFLADIAHHAAPVFVDAYHNPFTPPTKQTADTDLLDANGDGVINAADVTAAGARLKDANHDGTIDVRDLADVNLDGTIDGKDLIADDLNPLTYDNEMLDAHFLTGDGRGNENIGLTTVHTIFHSEHNRLVEVNKDTIIASGDAAVVNEWLLHAAGGSAITQAHLNAINGIADPAAKAAAIDALEWNGERLFQAARFVTEMQYQHLVFEEFARKVQPNVDPFVFTNSADLNPAIVAEFAHVVYRFGHSMLSDTVDRLDNNLQPVDGQDQLGLIEAFLNPQAFTASGATASDAAGAIIRGMTRQIGGEIDEFVVQAVRSNLLGLPLDLPALNIARGRDAGVPTFNHTRAELYAATGDAQLKPYVSWFDYAQNIKNPVSIINFIAAYGTHETILSETTAAGKRAAATELVTGIEQNGNGAVAADRLDFLTSKGAWNAANSGLNDVDLWIGGLAEEKMEFGGMLGSTFNYVFETQLENLQNGDRFYYLSRTQGMNLLNQLEPNTFADLVLRNTSLGDLHSTHVAATLFDTPDLILELDPLVTQRNPGLGAADPTWDDTLQQIIDPKVVRKNGTADVDGNGFADGNYLKFSGGEHVVLGGTEGNDSLLGDKGIDALWGDGGDDYLNAGMEADQVFGGDGDDIIEDPFGDGDFLRGNLGNDVVVDSHGFGDVLFGDSGKDFVAGGSDVIEIFAGEGDDFVLGGIGGDGLMGNEGDDWIEGGEGFDGLSGDNSELFFNSPIIGHDVLDGQGNDTDYDGESGDDIMVQGPGIQRNNGMLGFDWVIQKGDPNGGNIDLGISRFLTQQALTLRDRNDAVEGASGWKYNDTLTGTNAPTGAVGGPVGGVVNAPATDSMLLSQNVALINGLSEFLKLAPGALRGQTVGSDATPFALLPKDTTVFDPQNGGDILLGGGGSDLIFGKAGNDLIDGDRWLNVRIEVHANKDGTGPLVTNLASVGADGSVDSLNEIKADMLAGRINPGQLEIVREIITTGAAASDTDVAVYAGSRADYSFVRNLATGTVTVTDNVVAPIVLADGTVDALLGDEGIDTLSNMEVLRFADRDVSIARATGTLTITGTGAVLTADRSSFVDLNGLPGAGGFHYQWQSSAGDGAPWVNVGGNTPTFTVPTGSNAFYRVTVDYTDRDGLAESFTSPMTVRVGTTAADSVGGTADANLLYGLGGNDTLAGGLGNDTLDGGAGQDSMVGGAGDDTYRVDQGNDVVVEAPGGGIDTVFASVNYSLGTEVENLVLAGTAAINGAGNAAGNVLTGNAADNQLFGNAGNDTLSGGAGNDLLDGGTGQDSMAGGAGDDSYRVDDANDVVVEDTGAGIDNVTATVTHTLAANVENLTLGGAAAIGGTGNALGNVITGNGAANQLSGLDGNDSLVGGAGNDTLDGGAGNDTLDGGVGQDSMVGGAGDDTYRVDQGNDAVVEAASGGIDTVFASVNFSLVANVENLTLTGSLAINGAGNALANLLVGNAGNNQLFGLDGNDTLNGGAGNDLLNGGSGNDVFVFGAGFGADTITGFDADPAGGQDLLDFRSVGITTGTFGSVGIAAVAGGTLLTVGGGTVLLSGVAAATIDASDFILV